MIVTQLRALPAGLLVLFFAVFALAPGAGASWNVIVRGLGPADGRFKVAMTSDQLGETPVEKMEATTYYE